jgi:hypothetical protein
MRKPRAQLQSIAQEHLGLNLSQLDFSALAASAASPAPAQAALQTVSVSPQQVHAALEAAFAAGQAAIPTPATPPRLVGTHDHPPVHNQLRRQPQVIVLDDASARSVGEAVTQALAPTAFKPDK